MLVREVLNDVEQRLDQLGVPVPNRLLLQQWLQHEVRALMSLEDWDWAYAMLSPVIQLLASTRAYKLPSNFGTNFVRYADLNGARYGCKLISDTSEQFIEYLSPVQFHTLNLSATNTGKPSHYTITTLPDGRRQLHVDSLPDASYSVTGLYKATGWTLDDEDNLLPYPADSPIGSCMLLRRIFEGKPLQDTYTRAEREALSTIRMEHAQSRAARVTPVVSKSGTISTYPLFGNQH